MQQMTAVYQYMMQQDIRMMNLSQLAHQFHYSEAALNTRFFRVTGIRLTKEIEIIQLLTFFNLFIHQKISLEELCEDFYISKQTIVSRSKRLLGVAPALGKQILTSSQKDTTAYHDLVEKIQNLEKNHQQFMKKSLFSFPVIEKREAQLPELEERYYHMLEATAMSLYYDTGLDWELAKRNIISSPKTMSFIRLELTKLRLLRALYDLKNTDADLLQVAILYRFDSIENFRHNFESFFQVDLEDYLFSIGYQNFAFSNPSSCLVNSYLMRRQLEEKVVERGRELSKNWDCYQSMKQKTKQVSRTR